MGHVDSGKTTIAKWISQRPSTASFDKSPQSASRGITLDLGFSAFYLQIDNEQVQVTLVDCPGHASLFRTVLGAAHIIDIILIVVDGSKGIQTQTAECLVLAGLVTEAVIICINKVDACQFDNGAKIKRQLERSMPSFSNASIVGVSAKENVNMEGLINCIKACVSNIKERQVDQPLIMAIDHGFNIKGQGNILTGTVLQGQVCLGDTIALPDFTTPARIRSIQSFKQKVEKAIAGDRIGINIDNNVEISKVERSIVVKPGQKATCFTKCFLMTCKKIGFYKESVLSKRKYHISILHNTVMSRQVIFSRKNGQGEYEWCDELHANDDGEYVAIVELETVISIPASQYLCIGSKLDMNIETKACRLAFHGVIIQSIVNLDVFPLFKNKFREATIDRVVDCKRAIGKGLVSKEGTLNKFLGWMVTISDGVQGIIQSPFGTTGKFNINFKENGIRVLIGDKIQLAFKKYPLQPGKPLRQS